MSSQRGSALILALIMLTLLMILGSALLTSVTIDVAIGENYRSETQLLYLAESGVEEAKSALLHSSRTPSQLLADAAGADGFLSASRDLDTLLTGSDDVPFLNGGSRTTGALLVDTSGRPAGRYYVFLRNDSTDGMTSLTDTNHVLTLLSVAVIGSARKVLEVTIMRWKFPELAATLVLDGTPVTFTPSAPGSGISGLDASATGGDKYALGVLTAGDRSAVLATIPPLSGIQYPGKGNPIPPPADIAVVDSLLDPRLGSPAELERLADRISASATDIANPGWNGAAALGNVGSSSDYRVVAVNGDCELGAGSGFGILLVRGNLRLNGIFRWNGLVLVIGQGTISWSGAGNGVISGGVFVARTRANDRSGANERGTLLGARGAIDVNFSGGGNSLQLDNPGAAAMDLANQKFPYVAIAIREY